MFAKHTHLVNRICIRILQAIFFYQFFSILVFREEYFCKITIFECIVSFWSRSRNSKCKLWHVRIVVDLFSLEHRQFFGRDNIKWIFLRTDNVHTVVFLKRTWNFRKKNPLFFFFLYLIAVFFNIIRKNVFEVCILMEDKRKFLIMVRERWTCST